MKNIVHVLFATTALAFAAQASAQVTFYEQDGFQGRTCTTQQRVGNLEGAGFSDRASSVVVASAGGCGRRSGPMAAAPCCDPASIRRCRPWPDNWISSVRLLSAQHHVAERRLRAHAGRQDFRRRRNEGFGDAEVLARGGRHTGRAADEREQVVQQPAAGNLNAPGAGHGRLRHPRHRARQRPADATGRIVGGAALALGPCAACGGDARRATATATRRRPPPATDVTHDCGRQHRVDDGARPHHRRQPRRRPRADAARGPQLLCHAPAVVTTFTPASAADTSRVAGPVHPPAGTRARAGKRPGARDLPRSGRRGEATPRRGHWTGAAPPGAQRDAGARAARVEDARPARARRRNVEAASAARADRSETKVP